MKHWRESRLVFDAIAMLHARGVAMALATVVRVRGSAYRREGAKMLVGEDGTIVGNVSGGCLEHDVREVAHRVLRTGVTERRRYCSGADEIAAWDLGVGCEGEVELVVAPVRDPHDRERAAMHAEEPFVLRTSTEDGTRALSSGHDTTRLVLDAAGREHFVDAFTPPPRLLICGAGDDAIPLARFGAEIGFRVVVTDRRPGLLVPGRFPHDVLMVLAMPAQLAQHALVSADSYAVVMTHHFADDGAYLDALRDTPVPYIGMLGPRQRTERLLQRHPGFDAGRDHRVYGPVGLDIGTDGAEQVALSVLAEIMAVMSDRPAISLRERLTPMHVDVA